MCDDSNIDLRSILLVTAVNAFDIWKIIVSFSKSCSDKPVLLTDHLYTLEMQCFLELFWLEKSSLVDMIKSQSINSAEKGFMIMDKDKENLKPDEVAVFVAPSLCHNVFFKRFLQLAAERIY